MQMFIFLSYPLSPSDHAKSCQAKLTHVKKNAKKKTKSSKACQTWQVFQNLATMSVMPNHNHVIAKKAKLSYYGLPPSAP